MASTSHLKPTKEILTLLSLAAIHHDVILAVLVTSHTAVFAPHSLLHDSLHLRDHGD